MSDTEIEESLFQNCRNRFYVEPTSAAAVAGSRKYKGAGQETIVVLLTGTWAETN